MKKFADIALKALFWAAVIAYCMWAMSECSRRERDVPAGPIRVEVLDSAQLKVVTPQLVLEWIAESELIPVGAMASEIPIGAIVALLESRPFVAHAEGYVDLQGVTHLKLSQRRPLLRLRTAGRDCYMDAQGHLLPLQSHIAMRLPVVTGAGAALENNLIFLRKLINFVEFIRADDFWAAQVEQIHIRPAAASGLYGPDILLTIRAGDHRVVLGQLEEVEAKMAKLEAFYRDALEYEGWGRYREVDLSYGNQIVCR